jgi:hypothetical protein
MIPETKQVSLEEIDILFGGSNHVEKGANLLHVEDPCHAHIGVDNLHGDVPVNHDTLVVTDGKIANAGEV